MRSTRVVAELAAVAAFVVGADTALSQEYPRKPVRIVTTEVGSGNDIVARIMAPRLSAALGQPLIIDNRGPIAGELVARAPSDGYTLLHYGSPLWMAPLLRDKVPYDPIRDFAPITITAITPGIIVVNAAVPAKSLTELIALAKSKPGELNYASGSTGSGGHLAGELFKSMTGVNIVRIPYKGSGPGLNALVAGQVQLMFPNAGSVTPHLKSGRLRALAVASDKPSTLAPGVPTAAASGLPGFETSSQYGMLAPSGTPAKLIALLNQQTVRTLNSPDVKETLFNAGMEAGGGSPQELTALVHSATKRWGKVIRDANIRE